MASPTGLKKASDTALAKVDSFTVADADFIGQKCPNMSAGHKSIIYFLLAAANIGAQGAWATMGLLFLPIGSAIAMGFMGLIMIGRAFNEDEDYEDRKPPIDVPAQEVGQNTRLNAVPVPAEAFTEQSSPTFTEPNPFASPKFGTGKELYPQEVFASPEEKAAATGEPIEPEPWESDRPRPMDIARYIGLNPKPTLITAIPRVGKGIVVAQGWREFKQEHPSGMVGLLQPKPHATEFGYWEGVDMCWGEPIENYLGNPKELSRVTEELTQFINDWRADPRRPKLLIVDELVILSTVLPKWYKSFMIPTLGVEGSSGETDRRYLWAITQSALATDLGISTGNRSTFQLLTIQTPDSGDHLNVVQGSFKGAIPDIPDGLFEASGSPKKSVFYHSAIREWHPCPSYPVYEPSSLPVRKPEKITSPVGVATNPFIKSASPAPTLSLSWDFNDTCSTAEIDAQIVDFQEASDTRYHCVADFLQWLKEQGNATVIQSGDISRSNWAARWQGKSGGLTDRKGASIQPFISNCLKIGFLKEQETDKYEIVLF